MDSLDSLWIELDSLRIPSDFCWLGMDSLWIALDCFGYLWIPLDSCGLRWILRANQKNWAHALCFIVTNNTLNIYQSYTSTNFNFHNMCWWKYFTNMRNQLYRSGDFSCHFEIGTFTRLWKYKTGHTISLKASKRLRFLQARYQECRSLTIGKYCNGVLSLVLLLLDIALYTTYHL